MLQSDPFEVSLAHSHAVIIPDTVAHLFLSEKQKRVKVHASYHDQQIVFYAALTAKKNGLCVLMFSKEKQKALGVFMNDYFTMQLFEDQSKYGVDMPEELEAVLLSDHDAYIIFENLTPGKQRSIIYAILRYKSSQTRIDKSLILTENLKRGVTDQKLWLKSNR
ncbi:YdeI/OmpD-associated family protein [Psychroserpens sp.]|uniref:YdeI/OmpD-associated family protein n=1 Tax=Psychroserpens sp. TaxID=2020870 RepID=UPI001B1D04EC|nr:YdeI/OmpD-associated family protein [Psychroserpens sp.]MBO6607003.1 YdeI/OmpD-associated family protein [Psychroserpens sp.]MBO6632409.1 YdeI/OmpD-associated family protein [Psychroserpens sp.]MBO6654149.1 YdeI/OmpD-associated family protein [Psychroserpens sp.]MBO6682565.1 YdeI/OmpD-associated family protein [Psychroserpens sp.]MBO6750775.1 YdeI/OmpD-associated family protein [Psychroserpens sp.]